MHAQAASAAPGLTNRSARLAVLELMDVFLIPTRTSERYELYYEAPADDQQVLDGVHGTGVFDRMKRRFADAIREAEEWRHRRHDRDPVPSGIFARARRKTMGFVVERIAEQRLLWHMRRTSTICARIPADLDAGPAEAMIRAMLKKDVDHHRKWLAIDSVLLLLTLPLTVIPGPNIPAFYFTFQVVGHYLSMQGARQGLTKAVWTFSESADLCELRAAMALEPPQRQRRVRELAERLRLEHLATFCEQVAAPSA
jgi:hypothetical protein